MCPSMTSHCLDLDLNDQKTRRYFSPDSIADSDASAASNGGKQELMHYVHQVSSHLPPLDGADASDTIDTGNTLNIEKVNKHKIVVKIWELVVRMS